MSVALSLVLAKAATDLLRQDRGGLGGTKQEHRVHRRHVDALAENVDAEDAAEVALLESSQGRVAFCGCRSHPRALRSGGRAR